MKKSILIIAIFCLSLGACSTVKYVTTPLPVPVRPDYAKVSSAELQCMAADAYERLATSIKQRNEHIITLENIIKGTHQ